MPSEPGDPTEYPPSLTLHAGSEGMLTFGLDANGVLRHIDSVPNGKQCRCVCPACGEPLIARQGAMLSHSFAHDSGAECRWAQETVLHRLAKQLIAERGEFAVPGMTVTVLRPAPGRPVKVEDSLPPRTVHPDSVTLELLLFPVRPDVVLELRGRKLLIEIAVTHKVGPEKLARLNELGFAAVEIDLSRRRPATIEELAAVLFGQDDRKKWLVNPKADKLRRKLEAECEKLCEQREREFEASQARLAGERARENQKLATAMASRVKAMVPSKRYAVRGGALVAYRQARGTVLITIEGDPGRLCKALERVSFASGDNGYVLANAVWAQFVREEIDR